MSSKCNLLLLITYYPLPNWVWKTVPTQAGFTWSSLRAPKEAWRCQLYHYESQTEACKNAIRAQQNARSPWRRQGFTVNSTSEKYACHLYQYARFFFRASYLYAHRPSAGNRKRVWLYWLVSKQQPNHQLRHTSFAWLYPWGYNLCRIMWRWRFAKLWLGTRQRWGWRAWVAKVHCSISCDDATCEVSAATWQIVWNNHNHR